MASTQRNPSDLRALSDAELITSTRAGSDAAFAVLYERHEGAARAAARSLGASRADTDDLVAEAFTRVLSTLRRGGGPEVAFRPYLMTSVRNAFYDRGRKDRRLDLRDEVPDDVNLALLNAAASSEDAQMVARAFASLPERWQAVLWATEVEGKSPAEVGPALGLAPNAIAALAYRAREGLRQAFLQAHLAQQQPEACRDTIAKLGAYVRDGLSARDRRKVDEHLKTCEHCTALLLELEEVSTSLRGVLVPILLGVPATAYLAHLAAASGVLAALLRRRPHGAAAQAAVAAAVVGGLVVAGVAVAALRGGSGGPEQVSAGAGSSTTAAAPATAPPPSAAPPPAPPGGANGASPAPPVPVTIPPSAPVVSTTPITIPFASPPITSSRSATTSVRISTTTTTTAPATTTTTAPPATTTPPATAPPTTAPPPTTVPPPTTTTAPPPVPLSLAAQLVGPAYAGVSASAQITVGSGAAAVLGGAGRALTAGQAVAGGPVTLTVTGAKVGDWGVAGCVPTAPCVLPNGTTTTIVRLDLAGVATGATVPVTVSATAPGGRTGSASLQMTTVAPPAGLGFFAVDRGDIAMAANTVLTCPLGSGPDNNQCDTGYVTVDDAMLDSSSATLALPAGATVTHAVLRWGGDNTKAPDPDAIGVVELEAPGGAAAVKVDADSVRTAPGGGAYVASADVTRLVTTAGSYTVRDVQTGDGPNEFGGWSLIVAYRDPSPTAPRRTLVMFDDPAPDPKDLTRLASGSETFALTGLAAPAAPQDVRIGVIGFEGDRGSTGDSAKVGAVTILTPQNAFDSTIDVGGAARSPSFANQYGFDAHLVTAAGAWTGPSLDVTFATTGDTVYVGAVAMSLPAAP